MVCGTEVELVSALDDGRGRVDVEIVGRRRFSLVASPLPYCTFAARRRGLRGCAQVGEPWMEDDKYFMCKVATLPGCSQPAHSLSDVRG